LSDLKVEGKVLILGCGNVLLGDDGFGPAAAARCRRFRLSGSIVALDVGTQLSPLTMDLLYGEEKPIGLVILDAVDGGRSPGDVFRVSLDDLASRTTDTFGLHDFPSVSVFRELETSKGTKTEIIACQPAMGMDLVRIGLSKQVREAVPKAAWMAVTRARLMVRAK
jgi:coenzyme F420 hydrogenase subunit delta